LEKEIAIIGCGAIGSELAQVIDNGTIPNCLLTAIFDTDTKRSKAVNERLKNKATLFSSFEDFIGSPQFNKIDMVIEAASIDAAAVYGMDILRKGKDMMIMSIGVFSDYNFYQNTLQILKSKSNNIFLPSGAIGGIDIIRSVKSNIESVTLTTTKNNKSLKGAPFFKNNNINIDEIKSKQTIFDGNADEAIKQFPSNVNVSALISLSGIGFKQTSVKVVVDPQESNNIHEIHVKWKFGEFDIKISNKPSQENPKTSYLAILSAIECLRSICTHELKIGS
jgi:aspartate dehydrogenase